MKKLGLLLVFFLLIIVITFTETPLGKLSYLHYSLMAAIIFAAAYTYRETVLAKWRAFYPERKKLSESFSNRFDKEKMNAVKERKLRKRRYEAYPLEKLDQLKNMLETQLKTGNYVSETTVEEKLADVKNLIESKQQHAAHEKNREEEYQEWKIESTKRSLRS